MMARNALLIGSLLSASIALTQPVHSDELGRFFGTIAGEIVRDQMRQQQVQPRRQQPQASQPQTRQQTGARQQSAAPQPQQPEMSLAERMAVQRALAATGHYAGGIDGILGSGSRRAIAGWQASLGAAATGYLLPQQARMLIAAAPPPDPLYEMAAPNPAARPGVTQGWAGNAPVSATAADGHYAAPMLAGSAPAAPAAEPLPGDALIGDNELARQLVIWTIAQNPALLNSSHGLGALISFNYAPEIQAQRITDPALRRQILTAKLATEDKSPPTRAVLERWVQIQPAWDGAPPKMATEFADIEGVPTITALNAVSRGPYAPSVWSLAVDQPFFLPPPEGFAAWTIPPESRDELLLQIDITLSDVRPRIGSADIGVRGGSAKATINRVTLIRRPPPAHNRSDPNPPDEILHTWTGEAPATASPDRPADPGAIAAVYGGAVSGGRYVVSSGGSDMGLDVIHQPLLAGDWGRLDEALPLALSLRRLTEAAPDRQPDPQLTEMLSQYLLTARERIDLLPVEIAQRNDSTTISELALHAAMTENAAAVRDIVVTRAPDLPLAMRHVGYASLGEYDFTANAFPVSVDPSLLQRLPLAKPGPDMSLDALLPIAPTDAQALLDTMAQINPDGGQNRQLFSVVDYVLEEMVPRGARPGPITQAELEALSPRSRIESVALFIDPGLTQKLMDLPIPEDPAHAVAAAEGVEGPPEEIYATTGKSLWGAFARADVKDEWSSSYIMSMQQVYRGGDAGLEARTEAMRNEMIAEARNSYWIGAHLDVGEYDPNTGSVPLTGYTLVPVPYDNDISGVAPPPLQPRDSRDFAALQVTAEEAAKIDQLRESRTRIAAYLLIRPDEVVFDDENHAPFLTFARPEAVLLGPAGSDGMPDPVILRIGMLEPPRLDAAITAAEGGAASPVTAAPEALFLDQEGVDLLALSLDPAVYGDSGWQRMLIQRLVKERWFALEGEALRGDLPWGNFFANPQLTPQADEVAALLPAFRDWTMARAAALPQDLLLPHGPVPQNSPQCGMILDVTGPGSEADIRFILSDAASLLGDALPLPENVPVGYSNVARAGSHQVWAFDSAPPHSNCSYPRGVDGAELGDLIAADPDSTSALVHVAAVPTLGTAGEGVLSQLLRLKISELRLAPAEGADNIPAGLRAVVIVATSVESVTGYRHGRNNSGFEEVVTLTPQDWATPVAQTLASEDVVGLTIGMTLADFETAARAHLGKAVLFREETPGKGMFGHARGLLNLETGEALAAVYAPHAEGQPVVAIMRRLSLPASKASTEAVKQGLIQKYGALSREIDDGFWLWGTLPDNEDGWGVCGGPSLLGSSGRERAPELVPTEDLGQPVGTYQNSPAYWYDAGWPDIVTDRPGQVDPSRCGPVVGAMVADSGAAGRMLQLWLLDRKLAGEFDALPKPAVEAADIKF
ncbi:hypothetical protein DFP89_104174 [Paracoccus lutimaris]|uniref:Peptidoglycan binding-like domain-containing protein n=2 Tax=Paracoccus lutimaris TaxID=1490030 RepID=A0A368Z6D6_9RHOB|nr:hypothetical protein DFP89_104174 [Paracoccus lutimaris]